MTKPEWGSKHICAECGTRYYDMERSPVICPSCEAPEKIVPVKSRRTAASRSAKRTETAKPAVADNVAKKEKATVPDNDSKAETAKDAVASADEDEDDDAVIEDAAELGEDEKDVAEVVDGAVEKKDTET